MRYFLKMFVTGYTPNSVRAIHSVKNLLENDLRGLCDLQIIDVLKNPQQALDYEILATPTLIRVLPPPPRRVIGDLSNRHEVLLRLNVSTE